MAKVNSHLTSMEGVFKIYYDTLDKLRADLLKDEYAYLGKMDRLEVNLKQLVTNLKRYSLPEYYHEERELKSQLKKFDQDLDSFTVYLPKTVLRCDDMLRAEQEIKVDLQGRLTDYIVEIDHAFALENFDHIMRTVRDEKIKDIYRSLGPYDHFSDKDPDDLNNNVDRAMRKDMDLRKSGALYRGQKNIQSGKPDGYGFKIYPNNSIYEGGFDEGQLHG